MYFNQNAATGLIELNGYPNQANGNLVLAAEKLTTKFLTDGIMTHA